MAVVADASPIHYLTLIGCERILADLYGVVLIPPRVVDELTCQGAPGSVRELFASEPPWLQVRAPLAQLDDAENLDEGERQAIALALDHAPAVLLLIDDHAGRSSATRRRIRTLGTLGLLDLAATERLLNVRRSLELLLSTNFRVSRTLVREVLARDDQRRR